MWLPHVLGCLFDVEAADLPIGCWSDAQVRVIVREMEKGTGQKCVMRVTGTDVSVPGPLQPSAWTQKSLARVRNELGVSLLGAAGGQAEREKKRVAEIEMEDLIWVAN